jgi:hypothetical protein
MFADVGFWYLENDMYIIMTDFILCCSIIYGY